MQQFWKKGKKKENAICTVARVASEKLQNKMKVSLFLILAPSRGSIMFERQFCVPQSLSNEIRAQGSGH